MCCGLHFYNKGHWAQSCVNSCKFHRHCPPGPFCCGPGKVGKSAASCVGKSCKKDFRCASGESCCSDGRCAASSVGTTCDGTWIVQRVKLVVIALMVQVNVPLLVLENHVNMIHTKQPMNTDVVMLLVI